MAFFVNMRLGAKLVATFGMVILLMGILAALFFDRLHRAETAKAWTSHTYEVLDALDGVLIGMVNQETALRGFLLSGDERFLDTYHRGAELVDTNLDLLAGETADNPRAQALVREIRANALDWRRNHAERAKELRRDAATAEAGTGMEIEGAGKAQMDALRARLAEFQAMEETLLAERNASFAAAMDDGRLWTVIGVVVAAALAFVCGWFLFATTARPVVTATAVLEKLAQGRSDFKVPDSGRRDEIGHMLASLRTLRETVQRAVAQAQMIEEMPTPVMMADPQDDFKLSYCNGESRRLLERLEEHLPVRAKDMVGTSIDVFHKDPTHQRAFLADPSRLPHQATIRIGPELLFLKVSAIHGAGGEYVGPMLTWNIVTQRERMATSFETDVKQTVDRLTEAFVDMREKMRTVVKEARGTETQSSSVADAMEQANASVQTVAAAAEELSGSIREVGDQVTRSAEMSRTALDTGSDAVGKARSLSESADQIGEVVNLISDIAGQTNLLALNATIEAARAGEAGSGFAVVAREVKNLAEQTAKATEEIGAKITQMRTATATTVEAVGTVQQLIEEMSGIFAAVASAVDQQTAATAEISTSAQHAAQSTQTVSGNIEAVRRSSTHTGSSAEAVLQQTAELHDATSLLRNAANDFLESVRAA